MKQKFKCQLCKRNSNGTRCLMTAEYRNTLKVVCIECYQSYLAQYFGMSNKELTDYLKWSVGR